MSDLDDGDFLDREAEEDSDEQSGEDSDDSSEEEEEEGAKDLEDLIDDNVEEEGDGNSDEDEVDLRGKKRKKRKRKIDDRLEDEDFDLIAENLGIQLQRKKFLRVRLASDDEEEEGESVGVSGEVGGGEVGATRQTKEMEEVFGDSDEEDLPETQVVGRAQTEERVSLEERGSLEGEEPEEPPSDDDMSDFIVGDDGKPIRRRKGEDYFSEPALLEAQEIFGLDFDPAELDQLEKEGLESDEEGAEGDEEEYESDEEEGGGAVKVKRRGRVRKPKKTSIYDVYEPSELERGYFTEKDAEIRVTDMPERFQVRAIPVQHTEEGELDEEADWIYQQAFCKSPVSKQPYFYTEKHRSGSQRGRPQSTIPKIKEALNFMRNHFFEVPFIANYRKEYVKPELDLYDLWKIWLWDEKWMQLKSRKRNMRQLFERMQQYQFQKVREQPDKALTEDCRALQEEDIQRLEAVQTSEELSDVYTHFLLYYGKDLVAMQNRRSAMEEAEGGDKPKTTVKHALRRDFYSICQENGLGSLASKFGLTPEQFGENLRDNYQRHETEQHSIEPEEAAEDYVQHTGFFSSVRAVLQGACHMVAMQIAGEPLVRQTLRQVFQSRAVLSAKPTKKGRKLIDDTHPCCSMKYLRNKPIRDLKGDEYLRLAQAEQDHLMELKITVDLEQGTEKRTTTTQTYFEEIRQLFYRDEFSLLVEKWNAQRAQAVAHALLKVLYPQMEKELRTKLLLEAKDHVLQSCVHKFRKWLGVAPLPVKREDSLNQEEGPYARVVACAYTPDKTVPAFCCFLDGSGEVVDFLRLNHLLNRRVCPFPREREEKEEDLRLFKRFINRKRPDLVVVAAESREALMLVDELKLCLTELEQEEDLPVVPVELLDPNVARIYSKSRRAREQFADYPELLRMAISLGRRMQEPLHEFSSLMASEDEEVLALKMHSFQDSLSKDRLKLNLEIELVSRVNDIGVDVNFILEHSHAADMLSFVCGLGPRKTAALIKILKQESAQLQNRSQLVTQCSIGPQVFINCSGFIRIDTSAFSEIDNTYIEVLDSTRAHPETYEWARKMAVDALEYDETGDESNPSAAVEDILVTPEKLGDLDLDAFAEELERQDYGDKRITLYDIRDELSGPYKERRVPYNPLSGEEKFILLTGETPDSLYEGKLVTCTVVGIVRRKPMRDVLDRANPIKNEMTGLWQCPFCFQSDFRDLSLVWQHFDDGSCPGQGFGVRTRLESGLNGFILTKNISDKLVHAPEERVHVGMTIHCRILRVNLDKFSVDLTCRSSDLADREGKFSSPKDMYYDHHQAGLDKKKDEGGRDQPKQKYIKRVIVHPSFMNVSFDEAQKALAKMEQGEAIFRPSSKGPDHLTLTWKVEDAMLQHIDIKEQGKPNAYSLGRSLMIGDEEYEDLDEILARFVQPMAAFARDLLTHKFHRAAGGGDTKTLEKLLAQEKEKNPKRIPYFFSVSKKYPGKFVLAYQPARKPRVEYVSVTPDGFRYRNQTHSGVNDLVKWFKENYHKPVPRPIPTTTAQVPTHITQNIDPNLYPHLQAAVDTAHQQRGASSTPYTPSQWVNQTPTPQYGQQPSSYPAHHQQQQQVYGGYGYQQQQQQHGGQFAGSQYGHGTGGQYGGYQQRPGAAAWGQPTNWAALQRTPMQTPGRTPMQTPGRTPAYTPSQTPRSFMGSIFGTPAPTPPGRGPRGGPPGTPVLDE